MNLQVTTDKRSYDSVPLINDQSLPSYTPGLLMCLSWVLFVPSINSMIVDRKTLPDTQGYHSWIRPWQTIRTCISLVLRVSSQLEFCYQCSKTWSLLRKLEFRRNLSWVVSILLPFWNVVVALHLKNVKNWRLSDNDKGAVFIDTSKNYK